MASFIRIQKKKKGCFKPKYTIYAAPLITNSFYLKHPFLSAAQLSPILRFSPLYVLDSAYYGFRTGSFRPNKNDLNHNFRLKTSGGKHATSTSISLEQLGGQHQRLSSFCKVLLHYQTRFPKIIFYLLVTLQVNNLVEILIPGK